LEYPALVIFINGVTKAINELSSCAPIRSEPKLRGILLTYIQKVRLMMNSTPSNMQVDDVTEKENGNDEMISMSEASLRVVDMKQTFEQIAVPTCWQTFEQIFSKK